ncbi:hypothetical protein BJY52DRAFT_1126056, partial [Lactarius psammicola]
GTGNCDGAVLGADGSPVQVPCSCPPEWALFIEAFLLYDLNLNVAAGLAVNNTAVQVSFPTDNSYTSQLARLTAASVTLQNMRGVGVGCPIESTTFAAQEAALLAGQSEPCDQSQSSTASGTISLTSSPTPSSSSTVTSPSPSTSAPPGSLTENQVAAVAPPLGWQAGTGDCDGAVKSTSGLPIHVPCSCPPDQDTYISQLTANANAGHAVNNPSVQLSYPLDDSMGSRLARLNAASITLMNLQGPGTGCPIESTTFAAQQQAILVGLRRA